MGINLQYELIKLLPVWVQVQPGSSICLTLTMSME